MSRDTDIDFDRHGARISWVNVLKGVGWVLPFLVSAIVVYLHSEYVTHAEVQQDLQPLVALPARVEKLEDYRSDAKHQAELTTATTGVILQDMAVIKAQQVENSATLNRILHRLDQLADQRGR